MGWKLTAAMDLKQASILVTPTSFGASDPSLRIQLESAVGKVVYNTSGKPLKAAELSAIISDFDGYIAGLDEINATVIASAHRLRVISRYGVGIDNVDLKAAKEHGVVVTNTPGANSISVAELTVGLIISLARDIPRAVQATKTGNWSRYNGISLENKTVGLIGLGSIGKQTARRLYGFDCHLLAYDLFQDAAFAQTYAIDYVDLDQLLAKSDFILLHCPLTEKTRCLVDEVFLKKVKRGAFLINTARGELIDNTAVLSALQSGTLGGAALDVYTQEPPDANDPLLNLDRVVATPHMSSHTDGATNNMGRMALEDCLAVLRASSPLHPVK
jgi:D-3-phosphoglycerate dehydrogenase / 2-oxoglutarate reductase